jgi:3-oxoacyl-[acyl-carrier protein] reductase
MWAQIDRELGVGRLGKQPGELIKERVATVPIGRIGQPQDVADVVGFLASSKGAYMTGQAVNVTGGLVMY